MFGECSASTSLCVLAHATEIDFEAELVCLHVSEALSTERTLGVLVMSQRLFYGEYEVS